MEKEMSKNVGVNGRVFGGREKIRNGGERNDEGGDLLWRVGYNEKKIDYARIELDII